MLDNDDRGVLEKNRVELISGPDAKKFQIFLRRKATDMQLG